MNNYAGTSNLHPQGCGGASTPNNNSVSVNSNEIATVSVDSDEITTVLVSSNEIATVSVDFDEIATVSVDSDEITTVCTTDSDTYYIETPATVGVPWVDIASDDAGKFLSNDGERAYWQTVAYSEENFTTTLKEELESLISGDYSWKENQW